ncbi:MAG TPA: hypothetical protein PLX39_15335 [Pyrinomonadaceae bacterium]|nr:hypothetical protein [Pyrinomonadaceae bacterium]
MIDYNELSAELQQIYAVAAKLCDRDEPLTTEECLLASAVLNQYVALKHSQTGRPRKWANDKEKWDFYNARRKNKTTGNS